MSPRALAVLTVLNLALLGWQAVRPAQARTDPGVLRGTGLEIVDQQGRLRAQLVVEPENRDYAWPDGRVGYPETVIFRLVTPDGKPRVKLTTAVDGSGLMLLGDSDETRSVLHAERKSATLELRDGEQTRRTLGASAP